MNVPGNSYYVDHCVIKGWCAYCDGAGVGAGAKMRKGKFLSIDHIQPRWNWGANHWFNYTGACPSCNRRKSNYSLLEFLLREHPVDYGDFSSAAPVLNGFRYLARRKKHHRIRWCRLHNATERWWDPLGLDIRSSTRTLRRRQKRQRLKEIMSSTNV
jgi:hypothetical protein